MSIKSFDNYIENNNFKVLTSEGFKSFDGITKTKVTDPIIKLILSNGEEVKCTPNHKLYTSKKDKEYVKFLNVGDTLYTPYNNIRIDNIQDVYEEYVYDLINVEDTNSYLINPSQIVSSNCLYLDEFAFVENDIEFYTSTYPTVSSGKSTKIIITSTPNGLNMFYKIFNDASNGNNAYKNYAITWAEHPERDELWAEETRGNIGETAFAVEYECSFMGSAGTLIKGSKLSTLSPSNPLKEEVSNEITVRIFEEPDENKSYVMTVDTAEGTGNDFSAISIIDVTEAPYKQVFVYKNNVISPNSFAHVCDEIGTRYNTCPMLIESNNASGGIVTNELWYNIEYDNIILTEKLPQNKQKDSDIDINYGTRSAPGVRTTKKTKAVGCSYLKNLIETDQLIIPDIDTISQLSTFVRVGNSYEAEKNKNDDLVMTLVIFSWFTSQPYFEDYTGINTKQNIINDDDVDFVMGFMSNGLN